MWRVPDMEVSDLHRWLNQTRLPTATFDGPQDATVTRATTTGLWFTVGDDTASEYGPAPYPRPALHGATLTGAALNPNPHDHDPGLPPNGTTCLVVFLGAGVDRPRVLALYGWPTT